MFENCKDVVMTGRYELSEMLRKIDLIWFQGEITDDQKAELVALARQHADPAMSDTLLHRVENLEKEVEALKEAVAGGTTGPTEEWPQFELHHRYKTGDKVTFEGKHYVCDLPEHTDVTTWSPADYPGYWKLVA